MIKMMNQNQILMIPVAGLCGQWWTCSKNTIHRRVLKHNVGSGTISKCTHTCNIF
jgi:hypothetical protein